jgi:hypothetical protein
MLGIGIFFRSIINAMATSTAIRPTGDITTTSNTASDITGMSFAASANKTDFFFGYVHSGCNNTGAVMCVVT